MPLAFGFRVIAIRPFEHAIFRMHVWRIGEYGKCTYDQCTIITPVKSAQKCDANSKYGKHSASRNDAPTNSAGADHTCLPQPEQGACTQPRKSHRWEIEIPLREHGSRHPAGIESGCNAKEHLQESERLKVAALPQKQKKCNQPTPYAELHQHRRICERAALLERVEQDQRRGPDDLPCILCNQGKSAQEAFDPSHLRMESHGD